MNIYKSELLSSFTNISQGFIPNFDQEGIISLAENSGLNSIHTANQVHSDKILKMPEVNLNNREADSLYTDIRGVGIGVYTADCLPIMYFAEEKNIVGVVHAGWRGTLMEITAKTFTHITEELNNPVSKIYVAIGPCIDGSCYEVGEDVAGEFINKFEDHDMYIRKKSGGKFDLDLKQANISQLKRAGVTNIDLLANCTYCDLNLPSYRRDGKGAGRILSFIGMV